MKKLFTLIVGLLLVGTFTEAQISRTITYQGVLKDASGARVTGTVALDLNIYATTGGGSLYSDSHASVDVANGLFSLVIGTGSGGAISLPFDQPYELGVSIDSGAELLPRTSLTAAPYALNAGGVNVSGGSAGDVLTNDGNGNGAWGAAGAGPQGPQGKAGADGAAGTAGTAGADGAQGDPGPVGSEFWDGDIAGNIHSANSGNVGIGTTVPDGKLHVAGMIRADAHMVIPDDYEFMWSGTGTSIGGRPHKIYFQVGGGIPMQIMSDKRVLIGAADGGAATAVNPIRLQVHGRGMLGALGIGLGDGDALDEKLHVEDGNIKMSNSAPSLLINDSAESANGRLWKVASEGGYLRFQASRDDQGVDSSFLQLFRNGASADRTNIATKLGVGFLGGFSDMLEVAGSGNIAGDVKIGSFLTIGADKHIRTFQGHTLTINSNWDRFPKDFGDALYLQTQGGHVSIGSDAAPGATLHVYGDIIASGTITPSDARLKENVTTVSAALETLTQLRGVTFNWREDSEHRIGKVPEKKQIGMIAQEVEAVIPDAVHTTGDGYKGVNYQSLTGLFIEAIKDQQSQIEQQRVDYEVLKAEVETLRAQP